jgi:molybdate transport system substrate-binding protein
MMAVGKGEKRQRRVLLFGLLGALLLAATFQGATAQTSLLAYVGAGLKGPATELAQAYEKQSGVRVEMILNSSGALLGQLELSRKGDIYMPGGMPFVALAKKAGFIAEMVGPLAYHYPVIIVPKGNPAHISKVQDLARPGVRLILPDKESTALGKSALKIFANINLSAAIEKNVKAYVETGPKVPMTIMLGQGDAGIGEFSDASKHSASLEMVDIDPEVNVVDEIPCALLTCSAQPAAAREFLRFMKANGAAVFAKHGFKTQL